MHPLFYAPFGVADLEQTAALIDARPKGVLVLWLSVGVDLGTFEWLDVLVTHRASRALWS